MKSNTSKKRRSSQHNKEVSQKNQAKRKRMIAFGVASFLMVSVFSISLFATGTASYASDVCDLFPGSPGCPVPEISALEGTAALAVVLAVLMLAWERRRQA